MRRALAVAAALVVGLTGVASAHARLDKKSVPAGTLQALQLRVPGEEPDAGTVKVVLEIPAGFTATSCAPKTGWTCAITPDTSNGRNGLVTWTGRSAAKAVDLFSLDVRVPDENGSFPFQINQFYSDGHIAHWDQAPGEDHPAPVLEVTGASTKPVTNTAPPVDHSAAPPAPASPTATVTPAPAPAASDDGEGSGALPAALGIGGLVLVAGAFLAIRRRRA